MLRILTNSSNCGSCTSVPKTLNTLKFSFYHLFRRPLHLGEHFTRGSLNEIELVTSVPLAGRKHPLPSCSDTPNFPTFLSGPKENCPLLVKARNGSEATLKHWAKRSREVIDEAYRNYERDGTAVAILFRGLPVNNANDFAEWGRNLGFELYAYVGGVSPRFEIVENVSAGALDPNGYSIEPHNEMAYSVRYPKIFTMGCFKKASWGGETAICDNRKIVAKADPSFVEKCEKKKIRYWHYLPDGRSKSEEKAYQTWQMQFQTEDRAEVEEYLEKQQYSYEWEGSSLFYWNNLSPFIVHPISGERLWFNHVQVSHASYFWKGIPAFPGFEGKKFSNLRKYPCHTSYGDGEEIEEHFIDEMRRVTWESAVGFEWSNGDVLFMDQLIMQHSRLSFEGERKVGISLFTY